MGVAVKKMTTEFRTISFEKGANITTAKRLVAERSPKGMYCVRSEIYGYDERGGGGTPRPFSFLQKVTDRLFGYTDYTLSFKEAANKLLNFEKRHPKGNDQYRLQGRIPHVSKVMESHI